MAIEFNPVSRDSSQSIIFGWQPDYTPTTAFSLCAWANMRAIGTEFNTIFTRNDHMNLQTWNGTSIEFAFWVSAGVWRFINDNLEVPLDTWFHTCGTYDASSVDSTAQMKIYRNAQLISIGNFVDTVGYDNSNLQVAGNQYAEAAPGRFFQGRLSDVRLYNRALSTAEVETIYNCRGHDGIVDGLGFRSTFSGYASGATVSTVYDISEPPNDGTAVNGPKGYEDVMTFRKRML
jgi:hypothetical protein